MKCKKHIHKKSALWFSSGKKLTGYWPHLPHILLLTEFSEPPEKYIQNENMQMKAFRGIPHNLHRALNNYSLGNFYTFYVEYYRDITFQITRIVFEVYEY